MNYINLKERNAVILLWNGTTDKNILTRLDITNNIIYLNMIAYDNNNNKIFY